jgi:glycerate kinase
VQEVARLEKSLSKWRDISFQQTGIDMNGMRYGGAAGGIAAGLHTYLKAQLVQGIEYFLDTTNFDKALENVDLLITGEGSIDLQTLEGKGPYGVAMRARKKNIKVIGLSGKLPETGLKELGNYFDLLIPINQENEDLESSMLHTAANLRKTSCRLGKIISKGNLNNF